MNADPDSYHRAFPVNTEPHGGQIIVHSTSQHRTTWWSDHRAFHQSTQNHMVVRSSCIPPINTHSDNTEPHGGQIIVYSVNTEPHGGQIIVHSVAGQIIVHSTSQHRTTWWSEHRAFHQSTQNHMVVRSSCIPPINTEPHGGQIVRAFRQHRTTWWSDLRVFRQHRTTWRSDHRAFRQHRTTWRSDHRAFRQHSTTWWSDRSRIPSTQYHMVVRWTACGLSLIHI